MHDDATEARSTSEATHYFISQQRDRKDLAVARHWRDTFYGPKRSELASLNTHFNE
jgi:hypothetical protein